MSATMNTKEFLPALMLKYLTSSHQLTMDEGDEVALAWLDDQWQWHAVSLKDFQTVHIAAHEVEQYDLKIVARAITLSSVH